MQKIFELRQDHDYKIISNPSLEEAKITISRAEKFVSAIREYLKTNPLV